MSSRSPHTVRPPNLRVVADGASALSSVSVPACSPDRPTLDATGAATSDPASSSSSSQSSLCLHARQSSPVRCAYPAGRRTSVTFSIAQPPRPSDRGLPVPHSSVSLHVSNSSPPWSGDSDGGPPGQLSEPTTASSPSCTAHEEDGILDWESWKGDVPFWEHAVAGSCAGLVEHCVMYPLDTLKTRLQSTLAANSRGAAASLRQLTTELYTQAGWRGFFRGLGAICMGCVPAHAALFSVFEWSKSRFGTHSPVASSICGGLATLSHDMILTPTDVIKQRLQLGCYRGAVDCMRTVYRQEGLIAFYRSISTTLAMNIPFGAILVTTNEALKRATKGSGLQDNLSTYFLTAGAAGGIAGFCTTPMDVIKTRLQTQDVRDPLRSALSEPGPSSAGAGFHRGFSSSSYGASSRFGLRRSHAKAIPHPDHVKYTSFRSTAMRILQEEGVAGLWKGATTRFALSAPSAAVCWGTYETTKLLLRRLDRHGR